MAIEKTHNTILLVHLEESDIITKFTDLFEEKGFSLYYTASIEDAYQILGSQSVDIIVLDMDENYHKAFKFCYNLKKNRNLKKTFIIGLSAAHSEFDIYINAKTRNEKRWLNCDLFVHKPINPRNLYLLLKKEIAILQEIDSTDLDADQEPWL